MDMCWQSAAAAPACGLSCQVEAVPEVPDSGVGHVVDVDSPADLDVLGGAEVVKRRADQDIAGTR